jgi:hypothetical protein
MERELVSLDFSEVYFMPAIKENEEATLAEWRDDKKRIELYFNTFRECEKTPEFISWIINHEVLEGLILFIEKQENLYSQCPQGIWDHFPFACGLDEIYGFSLFDFKVFPTIKYQGFYALKNAFGKRIYIGEDFANKVLRFRGLTQSPIQIPQSKLTINIPIEIFNTNLPIYTNQFNSQLKKEEK